MPYRLIRSINGRRGGILFLLGLTYFLAGVFYLATPDFPPSDRAFNLLPEYLNANELGWVWLVAGLWMTPIALFGLKSPGWEASGFVAAIIPPSVWGFVFYISSLFGNPFGFREGSIYFILMVVTLYISGWSNPAKLERVRDDPTVAG